MYTAVPVELIQSAVQWTVYVITVIGMMFSLLLSSRA